jgi:hypothetical protein
VLAARFVFAFKFGSRFGVRSSPERIDIGGVDSRTWNLEPGTWNLEPGTPNPDPERRIENRT